MGQGLWGGLGDSQEKVPRIARLTLTFVSRFLYVVSRNEPHFTPRNGSGRIPQLIHPPLSRQPHPRLSSARSNAPRVTRPPTFGSSQLCVARSITNDQLSSGFHACVVFLNRLSPVVQVDKTMNNSEGIPTVFQHRTTGLPNYTALAAAALVTRGCLAVV